ncbi:MAG: hypothetical protein PHV34_14650 [Verrucomicrobiae bacterium]|nr:hypothetical protein [Verrucomicrobiae bacterium]
MIFSTPFHFPRKLSPPLANPIREQNDSSGSSSRSWALSAPIFRLPTGDEWNIGDACQGILILGATGSGKSSGSADMLAIKMLHLGAGGIVLCVKVDEANYWMELARLTGREKDIIRVTESQESFNIFDYELHRSGRGAGLTLNLVNLFRQLQDLVESKGGQKLNPDFWERACVRLISNAIQLQCALDEPLTLPAVSDIILTAPKSDEEADDEQWKKTSKCCRACVKAFLKQKGDFDIKRAVNYFLNDFPTMGDRQRSGITETWEGLADPLLRTPIRQKFCTDTTFTPEDAIDRGKIIVVDLPVKEFDQAGRIAGVIVKFLFQKAVERRRAASETSRRPCFIWADEFQHFVTSYDMVFQQTARSSKTSTVYIGQNLPTVLAQLGGQQGEPWMKGLFGNLLTKIFHANDEAQTNKFAADVVGEDWQIIETVSAGESRNILTPLLSGNRNVNASFSPQVKHILLPIVFTRLRTGTARNNGIVDAVFFQAGRKFSNGLNFCKVQFKQRQRSHPQTAMSSPDERQQSTALMITGLVLCLLFSHYPAIRWEWLPGTVDLRVWMKFWNKPIIVNWPITALLFSIGMIFARTIRREIIVQRVKRQIQEAKWLKKRIRQDTQDDEHQPIE